jgi:hypothetical protein
MKEHSCVFFLDFRFSRKTSRKDTPPAAAKAISLGSPRKVARNLGILYSTIKISCQKPSLLEAMMLFCIHRSLKTIFFWQKINGLLSLN